MVIETWTAFESGKYKGKTAPEVVVNDPAWFSTQFSRHWTNFPEFEVVEIVNKAACIAIPKPDPENWRIGWVISSKDKLSDFHVVRAKDPWKNFHYITDYFCFYLIVADMKINQEERNQKASEKLSDAFRRNYFGGEEATRERCESFFSNNDNFIWPGGVKGLFVFDHPQERHVWAGQR